MKKIVRLTESDLTRIVRRVIRETQEKEMEEGWLSNLFGGKKKESIKIPGTTQTCDEIRYVQGRDEFPHDFLKMYVRHTGDPKEKSIMCLTGWGKFSELPISGYFDGMEEAEQYLKREGYLPFRQHY